jgi:hypothetical protein
MSNLPVYRVFLSAVSSEFGKARSSLGSDLRARGLEVKVQEDFRQEADADTLLRKLHNYIRDCSAIVCILGKRSGSFPTETEAAPFADMLPKGLMRASYTQWEFFLARHYGKRLSLYLAEDGCVPDQATPAETDEPELQLEFIKHVIEQGLDRTPFATTHELCRFVLREQWPDHNRPKPILLPYPSLGTLFKGRDEFLAELRQRLQVHGPGRVTAIVGKALHGLGGVAKTRLAVEFAWQHQNDYSALLFVAAETPQDLRRNLAALVGPGVLDLPEHKQPEEDVRLAAALRWLREYPGWLLIVDNVDTQDVAIAVEELLARLQGGQVLITGRFSKWSEVVEPMELDVLEQSAAVAFLLERTQRRRRKQPTDAHDATELARELDGLALTLEQAGAYISQRRINLAEYLTHWRAQVPTVQAWHDPQVMKYPRSVAVTWETTFRELGAGEITLLRLLAWLAPDPVPLLLFEGAEAETIWKEALALLAAEASAVLHEGLPLESVEVLANYSLLRWDAEAQTVTVHRVVQAILRSRLARDEHKVCLALCLRLLKDAYPGTPVDVRNWPRWDFLWSHVAVTVARGDEAGIEEPTAFLMNELGQLLRAKALNEAAEPLMRRVLTIHEKSSDPDQSKIATCLNNLGVLLHTL